MGSEDYQDQVIKAFFEAVTGPERSLTRIYFCVVSLAKLRNESPEKLHFLLEQLQKSKEKHTLSIDIVDYVVDVVHSRENESMGDSLSSDDFGSISLDSL